MARARAAVRGRDQELAVLRAARTDDGGRLIVLMGPAGIGRTALLDEAGRMLRAAGARVLPVRLGTGPDSAGDDAFALAALARAVRDRFEEFQETGLADALGAVARLGEAAGRDTGGWTPAMVTALGGLFDRLVGRGGRTAVLADDAHAVAEPAPLLTAARRSGALVVATCEERAAHAPGPAELLATADQVVRFGPLADDVAESLVRRAYGARLDEALPDLLRTALGPLFGNPGTVLGTLADLRGRGRLSIFRGRLCLRTPAEPIELPAGHHLLRRVAAAGPPAARLAAAVALWEGVGVGDLPLLAEALGTGLDDCGRLLDRLIEAEVLVADPAGRVSCRCPALAAAVVRCAGSGFGVALHASVAERLLARQRRGDGVDPVLIADHVARGGASVVLDAAEVGRLLGLAADAERERPERAALWCVAALRRLRPGQPEHARTLTRLLHLVARTGQYELLREALGQYAHYAEQGRDPGSRAQIHLAAVLVALHSGRPPAEQAVRSLLDTGITGRERFGFAQWWFGRPPAPAPGRGAAMCGDLGSGEGAVGPALSGAAPPVPRETAVAEVPSAVGRAATAGAFPAAGVVPGLAAVERMALLSTALTGDPGAYERAWRRSGRAVGLPGPGRAAVPVVDLATMTQLALGARHRVPVTGVLGVYRRVVHGYTGADWTQAMSAVRELELADCEDTLVHHAARLLAADMDAARGEPRQAAQWLADVAPVPGLAVLRAWVRIGLYSRTGHDRRAAPLALRVSRRLRAAGLHEGLHLLLTRAIRVAAFVDDHDGAADLLAEIELLRPEAGPEAKESLLLARGLVRRDVRQARMATAMTKVRGDLPALLESYLVIARFAENPRPWLRDAHALATRCGAAALLERVREVTRERGVPAPRAPGRREDPAVTERRVVELIGEGLTNRQIALRLQLSEKTVENYLTRLFARTGCRSRVELAAASLAGRLTPTVT
ncbi:LuxR C-terminal-related transcriptional regulator [Streptomyces sp. JW3]|uniref:helix-turn-helix transcriptional regulator n=1 Tax=Streptomyces sp. JW3 TaxID=3456955 RepID=UPI003FA4BCE1